MTAAKLNSEFRIDNSFLGTESLTHGSLGNAVIAAEVTHVSTTTKLSGIVHC
jgi:hypothetical protein